MQHLCVQVVTQKRRLGIDVLVTLEQKICQKLARDQLVTCLDYDVTEDINFCELYVGGKHHCSSFSKSDGSRATQLLEIVQ